MQDWLEHKIADFDEPIALPKDDRQAQEWQEKNRTWWETCPMDYDANETLVEREGTSAYYDAIDRRFFDLVRQYMPYRERPFDPILDFASLRTKDMLEIGVGFGSHAQLIAPFAKSYTGIDLTSRAAAATKKRLEQRAIPATIQQMDAEKMTFADGSFDFIWSWGVIHHSSNTKKILEQMHRVLRPGGEATVMVYHRSMWRYYVVNGAFRGLLWGQLKRDGSVHKITQKSTDGAMARYYTFDEWRDFVSPWFDVTEMRAYGMKTQVLPLPEGRLKETVLKTVPDSVWRVLSNRLAFGPFLVAKMRRR